MEYTITFDYEKIIEAAELCKVIAGYEEGALYYASEIGTRLESPMSELLLAGSEPYGHSYVESTKNYAEQKKIELETDAENWESNATNLLDYLNDVKSVDNKVHSIFRDLYLVNMDVNSFGGIVRFALDMQYRYVGIELLNGNNLTREIGNWAKSLQDDLAYYWYDVEHWLLYDVGKYYLTIARGILGLVVSIIGVIISVVLAIFTGGTTAVTVVLWIGVATASLAAIFNGINAYYTVIDNVEAIDQNNENPAYARLLGNTDGYSDYIAHKDYGSVSENCKKAIGGLLFDVGHMSVELVSLACGLATSFCTSLNSANQLAFSFNKTDIIRNLLGAVGIRFSQNQLIIPYNSNKVVASTTNLIGNVDDVSDANTIYQISMQAELKLFGYSIDCADEQIILGKHLLEMNCNIDEFSDGVITIVNGNLSGRYKIDMLDVDYSHLGHNILNENKPSIYKTIKALKLDLNLFNTILEKVSNKFEETEVVEGENISVDYSTTRYEETYENIIYQNYLYTLEN